MRLGVVTPAEGTDRRHQVRHSRHCCSRHSSLLEGQLDGGDGLDQLLPPRPLLPGLPELIVLAAPETGRGPTRSPQRGLPAHSGLVAEGTYHLAELLVVEVEAVDHNAEVLGLGVRVKAVLPLDVDDAVEVPVFLDGLDLVLYQATGIIAFLALFPALT